MHQYLRLLNAIKERGDNHSDRTGVGTVSIFGYQMRFDLSDGLPILTTKKLSFKWIAEELLWFISGSTDVSDLQERGGKRQITIWDEWADEATCAKFGFPEGQLGPVYGHQWRNAQATKRPPVFNGPHDVSQPEKYYENTAHRFINYGYNNDGEDQLMNAVDLLKNNPRSRRIIVSGWDPKECTDVALPPCHTLYHLKWHEETNKLDCQLYQRSADCFIGVPYNIASYALLTCMLAHSCGMIPGEFIHTFGDVHIYNTHPDKVNEQLSRTPKKLPTLEFTCDPKNICDYTYDDFKLNNYEAYPTIKAEVAV